MDGALRANYLDCLRSHSMIREEQMVGAEDWVESHGHGHG